VGPEVELRSLHHEQRGMPARHPIVVEHVLGAELDRLRRTSVTTLGHVMEGRFQRITPRMKKVSCDAV
jgi:hypothetical protein